MEIKSSYDFVIIGSGFGGAVSALRLTQKGYKVLVIEKGKRFSEDDFPKSNWHIRKWLWVPLLRFFGFFKITLFRHITVLSGVGVGGGSLVYANTLQKPDDNFFNSRSWSHLADWHTELDQYYLTVLKMLGAEENPQLETGDFALQKLAVESGREKYFNVTNAAVFFGDPEAEKKDPYFNGRGPLRGACRFCGACMIGCQYSAKNTLDKNYLFLAEKDGADLIAESEVYSVATIDSDDGAGGYLIRWNNSTSFRKKKRSVQASGVIFSGGVLGTVKLLLHLKKTSLPNLSEKIGEDIRTNSESLLGVTTFDKKTNFSDGIAIGSIYRIDDESTVEPVRYPSGSGFWRLLMAPSVTGDNFFVRILKIIGDLIIHPVKNFKGIFVSDWAAKTQILLFMQTINTKLKFSKGLFGLKSGRLFGKLPTAFIPVAKNLSNQYAEIVNGKTFALLTESVAGIPTTAHILGGCVMGADRTEGVIDKNNRVFGYENLYVCDGSAVSSNPGVNPSLTIAAITERAMSFIPEKSI